MKEKYKYSKILMYTLLIFIVMLICCTILSKIFKQSGVLSSKKGETSQTEPGVAQESAEQTKPQNVKPEFPLIQVIDNGAELPDNQEYTGLVCSIRDTFSEDKNIIQTDGSILEEEVFTMYLNNVKVSVPDGGTRGFGIPIFSTETYSDKEQKARKEWHYVEGDDCPEFNEGIDIARQMILDGYFQKPLEKFLLRYPELNPTEREYVLRLTSGGRTDRDSDNTSWWDLNYRLETTADNGEIIPMAYIDITRVFLAQGEPVTWHDAEYRIWSAESAYWNLMEVPSEDLGKIWISQLPDEDFSTEEQIRSYVENQGGDFDCLLPAGADKQVDWDFCREETIWYEYLVWSGTNDTYEVTLAIPLMEEGAGGWYMASRIKRPAANKEICKHTLSTMMQTFHAVPYIYVVKEGDNLWSIYEKYQKEVSHSHYFTFLIDYNLLENPDLIYPGQRIQFPWLGL